MGLDKVLPQLKEGDIIFTSVSNYLYQSVEKATNSQTSHVGIILKREGLWVVAESRVPKSCYTPIEDFINRSKNDWFRIKRLPKGLSENDLQLLMNHCENQMGKLYHLGFKYKSKRQFCSKFVYDAYKGSLGIDVGCVETFEELLARNPSTSKRFWYMWYFGRIPWKRLTITPESQFADPKLVEVMI